MFTARLPATPQRFHNDESGSAAIIFGLSFMTLTFLTGMGVDYARISHAKTRVTAAADAAALTAGKAMLEGKLSDAQVVAMAQQMFQANLKNGGTAFANINKVNISIDRQSGTVSVDVDAKVDMTLTALAGYKSVKLPVSNAATFQTRDIEVGMALDITGSMGGVPSGGGPRKIDGLKDAFKKFAEKLIPDHPVAGQKVRIALAPYSAALNLGSYASDASNGRSPDGCVTERTTTDRYTDKSPVIGGYFNVRTDSVDDIDPTEGKNKGAYLCPSAQVTPLSSDRDGLIAKVNGYAPNGWTAGHIGVQWAWNLVSDDWGKVWGGSSQPDSYAEIGNKKLIKAVVLMTDGIFNTAYFNDKSSEQAIALCDGMKAKGVQVFAVAFDAPSDAQKTLKACASPGTEYYANANSAAELDAAFSKFAGKLAELHLSK